MVLYADSWIAGSSIVLLYRILQFQTEHHNSDCKYLVDIWEWGFTKYLWEVHKLKIVCSDAENGTIYTVI